MNSRVESYWEALEPRCEEINIYEGPDKYAESVAALPRLVVLLYATHMCGSEVDNGGFLQLFWNSTGVSVPEAIAGYTAMGMTNLAAIVSKAASTLGQPYPRDRKERWGALLTAAGQSPAALETILKNLDNVYRRFSDAMGPFDFNDLNREFWRTAPEEEGGFDVAATRYVNSLME
jgi:hypothetical protein